MATRQENRPPVLLREAIQGSDNIVFFGGAGVSTESGIPDFRSADGVYNMKYKYPPETIVSHSFFMQNTSEFYRFYREKMLHPDAMPNKAHLALAELERQGKLKAVVTQNVDGLHHKAGSVNVLELHGSRSRYYCMSCGAKYPIDVVIEAEDVPLCKCGGTIRPDVVLFEESLDQHVLEESVRYISNAEVLIVGGTSLNVYPAAGLIQYYKGDMLILINKTETPFDSKARIVLHESIGETLHSALHGNTG
ncbi:MAG: NAD-dependent protein deacylase [Oscillospiraceae bacterium]|nr:NAD-dependent protein deacylase [Oscillospiraceae bacterium]